MRQVISVQNFVSPYSCSHAIPPQGHWCNQELWEVVSSLWKKVTIFSKSPICSFSLLVVNHQVGFGAVMKGISGQNPFPIHVADVARVGVKREGRPKSWRLSETLPGHLWSPELHFSTSVRVHFKRENRLCLGLALFQGETMLCAARRMSRF